MAGSCIGPAPLRGRHCLDSDYCLMERDFPFPPVDVHVYHHSDDTKRVLAKILKRIETIMGTMQDLRAAVERNTSVDDSVLAMLEGISQQLKDAQAQNDPA